MFLRFSKQIDELDVRYRPIYKNQIEGVKDILTQNSAQLDQEDDNGNTLLHVASYYGRVEIALFLCEQGANVMIRDNRGRTALHFARTKEVVECLLL